MNILFHVLFNYSIVSMIFGIEERFIPVIIIFSIVLDFDHLPYILRNFKTVVRYLHFGSASRTRSHELIGLATFSLLFAITLLFYRDPRIIQVALLCVMLHYVADFLVGRTRPLFPYDKTEVFLHLYKRRRTRFVLEGLLTIIFGGIFFISRVQQ
jgi:membrane-bound metal-dependent hydrolase YbcI (DUF457 family)